MSYPHFIVHDVLQQALFTTGFQQPAMKEYGGMEAAFRKTMKAWEGHQVTLAVVAEGCGQTEWVSYIKEHPEWHVQCHGNHHVRYNELSPDEIRKELAVAKTTIERTFGVQVTEYYPPFNKYNGTTQRIAAELGMDERRRIRKSGHYKNNPQNCVQCDFHYWAKDALLALQMHLYYTMKPPTFIVGAPRSGTTAAMRWMATQFDTQDTLVLKEVEKPWRSQKKKNMRYWYAGKLARWGKTQLLDKNCRNSFRLDVLSSLFPEARFIHILRDGRAVANSWQRWAIKTKKSDTSIEGAARQWVNYVTHIQANKDTLANYEELRYEDLCRDEEYFQSRNGKWKKQLTDDQIWSVFKVAGVLLDELGYQKES